MLSVYNQTRGGQRDRLVPTIFTTPTGLGDVISSIIIGTAAHGYGVLWS